MAVKARSASRALQALRSEDRVAILNRIADSLEQHEQQIMAENAVDVAAAGGTISDSLLQRLVLKPNKIHQLAGGRQGDLGRRWQRSSQQRPPRHRAAGSAAAAPASPRLPPAVRRPSRLVSADRSFPPACRRHPRDSQAGGAGGPPAEQAGGSGGAGAGQGGEWGGVGGGGATWVDGLAGLQCQPAWPKQQQEQQEQQQQQGQQGQGPQGAPRQTHTHTPLPPFLPPPPGHLPHRRAAHHL